MKSTALDWHLDLAAVDRARILRGWSRRDLATTARVDQGTVSDLFMGRRRPTMGTIRALCSALELDIREVIAFEPDRR